MTQQLVVSGTTLLDASGNGTVTLVPAGGVIWHTSLISQPTTSTVNKPTAALYLGFNPLSTRFLESTASANSDATDTPYTIGPGDAITCQWTGGDAGARATLQILGTLEYL